MRADARANRDRILAVAEQLFAARGRAASTEEVARLAGVGTGTVFRHFPTKRDLLEAATVRHFEEAVAATERIPDDDPTKGFDATFRMLVSDTPSKTALIGLLAEAGDPGPAVQAASRALRTATEQRLRLAQQAGGIRPDVAIDEVYVLIRALAAASTMAGVTTGALSAAVEVALDGLRAGAD